MRHPDHKTVHFSLGGKANQTVQNRNVLLESFKTFYKGKTMIPSGHVSHTHTPIQEEKGGFTVWIIFLRNH